MQSSDIFILFFKYKLLWKLSIMKNYGKKMTESTDVEAEAAATIEAPSKKENKSK